MLNEVIVIFSQKPFYSVQEFHVQNIIYSHLHQIYQYVLLLPCLSSSLVAEKDKIRMAGWNLSSTTSGEHLKRILEMYEELGIEVSLERVTREECGECTLCYKDSGEPLYRVYTRQKTHKRP